MFMPTPPLHDDPAGAPPAKTRVLRQVLDFLRAMRTATSASPDEAIEWATLEQEFTQRTSESHEKEA